MPNILDRRGRWTGRPARMLRALPPVNLAPVAVGDALTRTRSGGAGAIAVLTNDYDPEGLPLSLISATALHGTALPGPNGTVTYTPPQTSVTSDTITYEVADPADNRATATVQVTILDPVITINSIGPQAGDNVPIGYSVSENVTCAAVLYLATAPKPTALQFSGGGAPTYANLGQVTLTTGGAGIPVTLPDGLNGSYKVALLPAGGTDARVVESAAVTLNTVVNTGLSVAGATKLIDVAGLNAGSTFTSAPFLAAAGANRMLLAIVSYYQQTPVPSTITLTIGAQAFTLVDSYGTTTSGLPRVQFLRLTNAGIPATAQTVTVTFNNQVSHPTVTILEMAGVNQTTPIGNNVLFASLSSLTTANTTLTGLSANGIVISAITNTATTAQSFAAAASAGGAVTQIAAHQTTLNKMQHAAVWQPVAGATSIQHTWTWATAVRPYIRHLEVRAV